MLLFSLIKTAADLLPWAVLFGTVYALWPLLALFVRLTTLLRRLAT